MNPKVLLMALLIGCCSVAGASTMYEIKYEFPKNTASPNYTAFLVRYGDGTGFMRVRFFNTAKNETFVVDMSLDEVYKKSSNDLYDFDELEFKGKDPVMIMGNSTYNPDFIWFKKSAGDTYFKPWGVTSPNGDNTFEQGNIISVKLLNAADLTSTYVNLFFATTEPFYKNLFKPQTTPNYNNYASKPNFYLINVANTNDPSIGKSCEVDQRRIQSEFNDICSFLGFNMVYKSVTGSSFSKASVQDAISSIYPTSNDVVVFCYSGHGFSYNNDDDHKYPQLDLRSSRFDNINTSTINVAEIYNQLKTKKARLNLVLSDCCNSEIGLNRTIGINFAQTQKSSMDWDWNSCASLFLNTRASIIVSAARKGEVAYCNSDLGGYFIYSFFQSLEKKFTKGYYGTVTWESLITEAETSTLNLSQRNLCDNNNYCRQDPIHWVANN